MYNDAVDKSQANDDQDWGAYFSKLHASGQFEVEVLSGVARNSRRITLNIRQGPG